MDRTSCRRLWQVQLPKSCLLTVLAVDLQENFIPLPPFLSSTSLRDETSGLIGLSQHCEKRVPNNNAWSEIILTCGSQPKKPHVTTTHGSRRDDQHQSRPRMQYTHSLLALARRAQLLDTRVTSHNSSSSAITRRHHQLSHVPGLLLLYSRFHRHLKTVTFGLAHCLRCYFACSALHRQFRHLHSHQTGSEKHSRRAS